MEDQVSEEPIAKSDQVDHAAWLAWEYRKAGLSMSQIAETLTNTEGRKISTRMVSDLLKRIYENHQVDDVAVSRALDAERLERVIRTNWRLATDGDNPDLSAQDRVMKAIDLRMKLLGSAAPSKTEITGANGEPVLDLAAQASQILDKLNSGYTADAIDVADLPELEG